MVSMAITSDIFSCRTVRRCLQAHITLIAPWAFAKLTIICMDKQQYRVIASTDLPSNTRIYELVGKLSVDHVDGDAKSKTMTLSEMFAEDGTTRVLYGPIQLVNHSYRANTAYEQYSDSRGNVIVLVSTTFIKAGEQITVDYGDGYFEDGCQCQCESCQPNAYEGDWKRSNRPSRIIVDAEEKRCAKTARNKRRKELKKAARRGTTTQAHAAR
ncbi:hypothetical protein K438DRAFT_1847066 [Mycena galopus ATCC 62051]|nr:hypothetical protein K438DRAFT_1847066 [Mycena galopus ATCC 62051]